MLEIKMEIYSKSGCQAFKSPLIVSYKPCELVAPLFNAAMLKFFLTQSASSEYYVVQHNATCAVTMRNSKNLLHLDPGLLSH